MVTNIRNQKVMFLNLITGLSIYIYMRVYIYMRSLDFLKTADKIIQDL